VAPLRAKVVEDVAEVFGALAHPTRVRIVALLHHGDHDVSELSQALGLAPTNVSQHLGLLRLHHLVTVRRDGTRMHYSIRDPRIGDLIDRALDLLTGNMARPREVQRAIEHVRQGRL